MTSARAEARHRAGDHARHLKVWLVLLCLAELADLMTTRADRLQGGIEVNQLAAFTLGVGGAALFWAMKLSLVLAMAAIVLLAVRLAREFPAGRARIVRGYVARSIQVCVLLLATAAISNLAVLAHLPPPGWFGT